MLAKTGNSQSIVVSGESGAGEDRTRRVEVEFIQGSGIKHAIKVMDKYADSVLARMKVTIAAMVLTSSSPLSQARLRRTST